MTDNFDLVSELQSALRHAAAERDRLREAIITHRDAIQDAGTVRVVDTESALAAAAKHSIDLDLWEAVHPPGWGEAQ